MNEITIFNNARFGEVRTIVEKGNVLFCGVDVATALGYAKPQNAIAAHCKGALKRGTPTSSGIQTLLFIPEPDIYRLAIKSKLPGADEFERWIFEEVLPSIRKTGGYSVVDPVKAQLAEARLRNARAREASMWVKIGAMVAGDNYKQICAHYASQALQGVDPTQNPVPLIELPKSEQRHYSASEVGKMLGISAQKVGRLANAHGLKTNAYGAWYHDKSPHSPKEIETFRYNDAGLEKIRELVKGEEYATVISGKKPSDEPV